MTENLSKVKLRIFISNHSLPIIWLIIICIKCFYPGFPLSKEIAIGLCIGSLFTVIFNGKFLIDLNFGNGSAKFTYVNQLLIKKEIEVPMNKMSEFKYHKSKWFGRNEYHFLDSPEFRFILLGKMIKEDIQSKMQTVGQN